MASRFVPDNKSFGRFILSAQVAKPVRAVATLIKGAAAADSPRSSEVDKVHLADAYKIGKVVTTFGSPRTPRVSYEVTNAAPAAVPSEFGSHDRPGLRTLRKAGAPYDSPKAAR